MKTPLRFLLATLFALVGIGAWAQVDYAVTKWGNSTHGDRYTKSISLTTSSGTKTITGIQTAIKQKIYWDRTDEKFTCAAGETVTPAVGFVGNWMNSYVYIDENGDGFSASDDNIGADHILKTGSDIDLRCYSKYNGGPNGGSNYNSLGQSVKGENYTLPSFTAPTTPGTYRMRYKVDWNCIDPEGNEEYDDTTNPVTNNRITNNGGIIVDVMLEVLSQEQINNYNALLALINSSEALVSSTRYSALITDVSQISSNASDTEEGQDLGVLIDGNSGTHWHSDWHNTYDAANPHYVQFDLGSAWDAVRMTYVVRNVPSNGAKPSTFTIQVADAADGEYADLQTIESVPTTAASEHVYDLTLGNHQYVRVVGASASNGYWAAAELNFTGVNTLTPNKEAVVAALEAAITTAKEITVSNVTAADIATLQAALDAVTYYEEPVPDFEKLTDIYGNAVIAGTNYLLRVAGTNLYAMAIADGENVGKIQPVGAPYATDNAAYHWRFEDNTSAVGIINGNGKYLARLGSNSNAYGGGNLQAKGTTAGQGTLWNVSSMAGNIVGFHLSDSYDTNGINVPVYLGYSAGGSHIGLAANGLAENEGSRWEIVPIEPASANYEATLASAQELIVKAGTAGYPASASTVSVALQALVGNAPAANPTKLYEAELEAAIAAFKTSTNVVMPTAGVYLLTSGMTFNSGNPMAMYANGTAAKWTAIDANNTAYWWILNEKAENKYSLQSFSTGNYVNASTMSNNVTLATSEPTGAVTLVGLGDGRFNINPISGPSLHAGGHDNGGGTAGNIVGWNNANAYQASAWQFVAIEASVLEAYMNDAADAADAVINLRGVGYPATDSDEYTALAAAIANVRNAGTLDVDLLVALESALSAYKSSSNIEKPVVGGGYRLSVISSADNSSLGYVNYAEAGINVAADSEDAVVECVSIEDGKYVFRFAKSCKYLVYKNGRGASDSDAGMNENKGWSDEYAASYAAFAIGKVSGVKVDREVPFGCVSLTTAQRNATDSSLGCLIVNNSNSKFDTSTAPFFNGSYTSAFMIEDATSALTAIKAANVAANEAAAQADMDRLEELQARLTLAIYGKDDCLTSEERATVGIILGDTYTMLIGDAYAAANAEGVPYVTPDAVDFDAITAQIVAIETSIATFVFSTKDDGAVTAEYALFEEQGAPNLGAGKPATKVTVYTDHVVIYDFLGVSGCNARFNYYYDDDAEEYVIYSAGNDGMSALSASTLEDGGMGVGSSIVVDGTTYRFNGAMGVLSVPGYIVISLDEAGYVMYKWTSDATGIREANASVKSGAIYNLNGQRVNKAQNGLYIINGKKVVVK